MRMNLQKRALIIIAFLLFLAVSLNTAVLTYISYERYKKAVLSRVVLSGESLITEIHKPLEFGILLEDIEGLNEKLGNLLTDEAIASSMIIDKEGKILFHNDSSYIGQSLKDASKPNVIDKKSIQEGGNFYNIDLPLKNAIGENVGILRLVVKATIFKKELYNLLLWATSISGISFLVFGSVIYLSISKFITKPIIEMEKIAKKISCGDLTESIKNVGKDEIASLSNTINNLASNLRDVIFKIKTLSSNVSDVAKKLQTRLKVF